MSLILDALNRADKDRAEEQGSYNLHTDQAAASPIKSPVNRWVIEIIVILLILTSAYFYFQTQDNTKKEKIIKSVSIETSVKTVPQSAPPKSTTFSNTSKNTDNVLKVTPALQNEQNQTNTSANTTLPNKVLSKRSDINSLYQQRNDDIDSTITSKNNNFEPKAVIEKAAPLKDDNKLIEEPATKKDDSLAILEKIPLLSQLSLRFQQSIPSINYSLHVYADTNSGFVTLNGSRYRVGGKPSPNLRVIAILKDSLVLDYQGKQFRLMALNSWVNFN